jgi:putative DNA primase/helicase
MAQLPPLDQIAKALGGDVVRSVEHGDNVVAPGPNHSADDRSLSVKLSKDDPEGFTTHSFSGDDWKACREHVRKKLGLPEPKQKNGGGKAWTLISEHIYRDEKGAPYLRVRKCLDERGKKQYPQAHWNGKQWVKGKPKDGKLPYRLAELRAAPLTSIVYLTEGEKCADAVAKIGLVATTASEGCNAKWAPELTPYFNDRRVVVLVDSDKGGREHGQKVARALDGIAASLKVIDLFPDRDDGSDVADWLETDTVGVKLLKAVNDAPVWEPSEELKKSDDEVIAELAALPRLQYEKRREEAAEQLDVRVSVLDKIVAEARGERGDKDGAPALYEHWNVEPWDEPVDTGILLRTLTEAIRRFVFLSEDQAVAVALWIVFSWLHERDDFVTHSPILFVTSAEKDSGKSTLLGVVNFLARRSLQSVEISGAALFRSIAKWRPTLIVDEADDALVDNPDLRSVINSGWTRGQGVIRCHPETHEPELFSTFAPKVVGMKGRKLPDTTLSRSIVITMRPRRADDSKEHTDDFAHSDTETFARLRSQLARWAADSAEDLAVAKAEVPPAFHYRRRANWMPLLAIAEAGGGDWKQKAWKTALAIEATADTFDRSIGVQLLQAIKDAFEAEGIDRMTSVALIAELVKDETGPWATYNKGKPISQRQIATLLKAYEARPGIPIRPRNVRVSGIAGVPKGYLKSDFVDVLGRLLPPSSPETPFSSATPLHGKHVNGLDVADSPSGTADVADENGPNLLEEKICSGVADENLPWDEKGEIGAADGCNDGLQVGAQPCEQDITAVSRCGGCRHGGNRSRPCIIGRGARARQGRAIFHEGR